MSVEKQWSPAAQITCEVCAFIWGGAIIAGGAYVVFWLERSGWWFAFALLLMSCWSCKGTRSPEQLRAAKGKDLE